jgi:hypothetical protein
MKKFSIDKKISIEKYVEENFLQPPHTPHQFIFYSRKKVLSPLEHINL